LILVEAAGMENLANYFNGFFKTTFASSSPMAIALTRAFAGERWNPRTQAAFRSREHAGTCCGQVQGLSGTGG
jgi:hypothetical protein